MKPNYLERDLLQTHSYLLVEGLLFAGLREQIVVHAIDPLVDPADDLVELRVEGRLHHNVRVHLFLLDSVQASLQERHLLVQRPVDLADQLLELGILKDRFG